MRQRAFIARQSGARAKTFPSDTDAMRRDPRYREPFHWWGPGWDAPASRSIGDLLRDGTLDSRTGAVPWAALARRKSVAVVAGPSGAGKTTLLTALLEFLPPDTNRLYLRGCFETFAFLSDAVVIPSASVMLVNEISPHLPIYLWGPAVARALDATERGFSLLATAHAESVVEFVGSLTGSPLRIPAALVAAFEFVVVLGYADEVPSVRRVREVSRLTKTGDGVAFESLSASPQDISQENQPPPAIPEWFPALELIERQRILEDLKHQRIVSLPLFRGVATVG
jgi:energy-coupling factor transporter ATP-binding protein EcfA2